MSLPVVRLITRLNIGGPAIQAATLTDRLETHGFHTHLVHGRLAAGEGDMSYLLRDTSDAVQVPHLQRPVAPLADMRAVAEIYSLLRRVRPRIVHTHMAKAGAVGRVAAAMYNRTVARADRARVVHTYHGHVLEGYFGRARSTAFITAERALARVTDCLIAISARLQHELVHEYRIGQPSQYRLVPLGFDLSAFARIDDAARQRAREQLNIAMGVPTIATAGRLTAIKQHELLLAAARIVANHHRDLVVLIAGDGERRSELHALVQRLQLDASVRFLGWRRDLPTVYAATDLFVLSSRNEGTPVALIEAMASAVPGVSTDVGGVPDVIDSEAMGLRVRDGDAAALADAIALLLSDPPRRAAMGQRARAHVLSRFTLDRLVTDIATLYRSLL
jgi:glycosyltransferase involved in cell wall biosynthesis